MSIVSESIKELRKKSNMTQEELAESLSVTRQAVSNWETDKTQPDIETLKQLAKIFEVDVERIIYGKSSKYNVHFSVKYDPKAAIEKTISAGSALAMVISYVKWQSVGWAILHGIFGWGYVIYYMIKY